MKLYLQLNEPGSGEIKVPMADSLASQITIGKYIRVAYRGEFRGGFFVENIQQTPAESGDKGGQWLTANGRGPLALLDDAIIWYAQDGQATRKFENQCAAQILITLLQEAQARGCFSNLVCNFTTAKDSNSQTWTDSHTLNLRVGTSLLDVVRQFAGLGFEFNVDVNWATNQFVLQMYRQSQGRDLHLQTVFDVGNNAKQLRQDSVGSELKNVLLVEVAGGVYTTISDSGSISIYRRREKHFAANQAETTAQGQILANPELSLSKDPSIEIALSVVDAAQYPRAFIDYSLGDWIGVRWQENSAPVSYRIRGMQLDWEESGYATITLELNSVRKETEIRLAQALRKIAGGSGASATSAPPESLSLLSQHDQNQNAHPNRIDDAEKIRGKNVSSTAPTNNQILLFNATADEWQPANQPPHTHTESDITNLGQTVVKDGDPAGGDLGGTYPNPSVNDDSHNHTAATLPATMPPSTHAASHKSGGADEVATETPGANAIPKANASGKLNKDWYPDFVGSGASHAKGAVPDPGPVAGTTKFLREDGTWQVPAGGGGGSTPSIIRILRVALSANFSFSTQTWSKVAFDTVIVDETNAYDTSNYRWTPPAGRVIINVIGSWSNSDSDVHIIAVYKNGSVVSKGQFPARYVGTSYNSASGITVIESCNGNDYFEVFVYRWSGNGYLLSSESVLQGIVFA